MLVQTPGGWGITSKQEVGKYDVMKAERAEGSDGYIISGTFTNKALRLFDNGPVRS